MAIILVSHNLGVVAGLSDHIAVMYAGKVVEYAPAEPLFATPKHPYTEALLKAIPLIESETRERLANIPGTPPDLIESPPGCRFHPRCEHAFDRCRQEIPPLLEISQDHMAACWLLEERAS